LSIRSCLCDTQSVNDFFFGGGITISRRGGKSPRKRGKGHNNHSMSGQTSLITKKRWGFWGKASDQKKKGRKTGRLPDEEKKKTPPRKAGLLKDGTGHPKRPIAKKFAMEFVSRKPPAG